LTFKEVVEKSMAERAVTKREGGREGGSDEGQAINLTFPSHTYIHKQECLSSPPKAQEKRRRGQLAVQDLRLFEEGEEEEGREGGREDLPLPPDVFECACSDPHRILYKGIYAFSYEYYLNFFPAENLHVVTAEELRVRKGGREGGREERR